MKKLFFFTLAVIVFLFSSCGKAEEQDKMPEDPRGSDGKVTVLLDAGHGFRDVGCTSEYLEGQYEYQLTMDFVCDLKQKLEAKGYTVILTHDGESYISESELCALADKHGITYARDNIKPDNSVFDAYERAIYSSVLDAELEIDFMLSIHVNANASSNECVGFEIDYCAENESSAQTKYVFDSICRALERDFEGRELKKFADSWADSFIVTKYNTMPSILFETGFASTPSDAELLLDPEWRSSLTDSLALGIIEYFEIEYKK